MLSALSVLDVVYEIAPAIISGACCWLLQKQISKRDAKIEKQDADREEFNILLLTGVNASTALSEATATALKNGHCNGEMEAALKYAREVKHAQKEFLSRRAIQSLGV